MKKAFTIPDLLIVIAIIAILAAVMLPAITSIRRKAIIQEINHKAAEYPNTDKFFIFQDKLHKFMQVAGGEVVSENLSTDEIKKIDVHDFKQGGCVLLLKEDVPSKYRLDGPEELSLEYKVGQEVYHVLNNWHGIVSEIEDGKYSVRFTVDGELKLVEKLTAAELKDNPF